jgi:hypothetical protein
MSDQAAQEGRTVYWYNIRTGQVQTNYDKGQGRNLLGPYPTADQARRAVQAAAERTAQWDEEDRREREGDDNER